MDRSIFDQAHLSRESLVRAVSGLGDRAWAQYCMDAGLAQIRSGRVSFWMPRLTLLAALCLDRAAEFLPQYEHFLLLLDQQPKSEWHKVLTEAAERGNLVQQSGRYGSTPEDLDAEFKRLRHALGAPDEGVVADIGCGGGLWAIRLAQSGYRVIGTERYDSLVDAARENAAQAGVADRTEFRLDDICASSLPSALCSRALCIAVTPTLRDDAAFDSLLQHLDRITGSGGTGPARCVLLGRNRWGPSRMTAVEEILDVAEENANGRASPLVTAADHLHLVERTWWLQPHHLERARRRFGSVEQIGEWRERATGAYVDFGLR